MYWKIINFPLVIGTQIKIENYKGMFPSVGVNSSVFPLPELNDFKVYPQNIALCSDTLM